MHECNQVERFNNLNQQVAGLKVDLDEHRKAQQEQDIERLAYREERIKHDTKLLESFEALNKTVNDKLMPVYEQEQKKEIAEAWIKEKAKTWKFWSSVLSGSTVFFIIIGWILKQIFRPDLP